MWFHYLGVYLLDQDTTGNCNGRDAARSCRLKNFFYVDSVTGNVEEAEAAFPHLEIRTSRPIRRVVLGLQRDFQVTAYGQASQNNPCENRQSTKHRSLKIGSKTRRTKARSGKSGLLDLGLRASRGGNVWGTAGGSLSNLTLYHLLSLREFSSLLHYKATEALATNPAGCLVEVASVSSRIAANVEEQGKSIPLLPKSIIYHNTKADGPQIVSKHFHSTKGACSAHFLFGNLYVISMNTISPGHSCQVLRFLHLNLVSTCFCILKHGSLPSLRLHDFVLVLGIQRLHG